MKRTCIYILIAFFCSLSVTVSAEEDVVYGVTSYQEGNDIVIDYCLKKNSYVKVYVSLDGGNHYDKLDESCLYGDFGKVYAGYDNAVYMGLYKKIRWNVFCQYPSFVSDQVVFKVEAKNTKKTDKNMLYNTYLLAECAFSFSPNVTEGLMVGGCRRFGWYLRGRTNFKLTKDYQELNSYSDDEYYMSGKEKKSEWMIAGGLLVRLGKAPVLINTGLGYGSKKMLYEHYNGGYCLSHKYSHKGLLLDWGMLFNIKRFTIAPGLSFIMKDLEPGNSGAANFTIGLGLGANF